MSGVAPHVGPEDRPDDVLPAELALWPPERLGHFPAEREHHRRRGDAGPGRREDLGRFRTALGDEQPQARLGHPDVRPWASRTLVPVRSQRRGDFAGLPAYHGRGQAPSLAGRPRRRPLGGERLEQRCMTGGCGDDDGRRGFASAIRSRSLGHDAHGHGRAHGERDHRDPNTSRQPPPAPTVPV